MLALASQAVQEVHPTSGNINYNPCVTVQGRLYHKIGPLLPDEDRIPSFAQI